MINRTTIRPACINAVQVSLGSVDKLRHSKLGAVLCHAERLEANSSRESPSQWKHTCNLSDLTVADREREERGLEKGVWRHSIRKE